MHFSCGRGMITAENKEGNRDFCAAMKKQKLCHKATAMARGEAVILAHAETRTGSSMPIFGAYGYAAASLWCSNLLRRMLGEERSDYTGVCAGVEWPLNGFSRRRKHAYTSRL
jgi:hypothetical protein